MGGGRRVPIGCDMVTMYINCRYGVILDYDTGVVQDDCATKALQLLPEG